MRRSYLFSVFGFLLVSIATHGQSIKRSVFGFYGNLNSQLISTAGQSVNNTIHDSSHQVIVGFQQPLSFPTKTNLNLLNDSVLCANEAVIFRSHKNIIHHWYKNDSLISVNTDSLLVSMPGSYHLVVSDGIRTFDSSKKIFLEFNSKIPSPIILNTKKDSTLCLLDTIHLTTQPGSEKYIWSTGDTTQSILVSQPGTYYLQTSARLNSSNKFCLSDTSIKVNIIKNPTPIPSIIRISDNLVTSQSIKYKWYFNNLLLSNDTTNSIRIHARGLYKVKTSLDDYCWSESTGYFVQTDPTSFLENNFKLSAYPNPTNGIFFLQLRLEKRYSGFAKIIIVDPLGNIKWSFNSFIFNDMNIKIPFNLNFNKGLFTIQVSLNGFKPQSIQLIGL